MISLDSDDARSIGFTSDLFKGWLWKVGDQIYISMIESLHEGKGNMSRLFASIEAAGYRVTVPTPLAKMRKILLHMGFRQYVEFSDELKCEVDVWRKPLAVEAQHG